MRFEVPSLYYLILTKLGDIIDRLTRNLSENVKHIQLSDIMLQLKATSFASFSSLHQFQYPPSFSDSCESPIGRSPQIFRMISFKEPKISPNNTSKIIEFRQITRVLDIFLLPKPRITNFVIGLQPNKTRAELDSSTVLKQIFYEYHPLTILAPRRNSLMIPKRYNKFDIVKMLTLSYRFTTYQDARRVRLVDGLDR